MGQAKRWLERQDATGVGLDMSEADLVACELCVADEGLRLFVSRGQRHDQCDFCGAAQAHGLHVIDLFEYMVSKLEAEWDDPNNSVGWSGRDGGWVGARVLDTWDLLSEIDDPFESDKLRDLFVNSVDRQWCQRNPYSLAPDQRLMFGWEAFVQHVRHSQRYLFLTHQSSDAHEDDIGPAEMLGELERAITRVGHRLFLPVPAGTKLLRGRVHASGEHPQNASELGSPPELLTKSYRMSPAGISMFYGADDLETVQAELGDPTTHLSVATWSTQRDVIALDLASLPHVPSIFDMTASQERPWIAFLRRFAAESSRPAGAHAEIDYVPTQVFTEYVRSALIDEAGRSVEAIRYRSSLTGGICWVVFASPAQCSDRATDDRTSLLAIEPDSIRRYEPGWVEAAG